MLQSLAPLYSYQIILTVINKNVSAIMSRIERKYCLISTSYLAGLFDIFILLHIWQNWVCFGDFLSIGTLRDVYHKEFESH